MGCQLSRRRFLGLASIVGASMAGASLLGACAPKPAPAPEAPAKVEEKAPAAPAPKEPIVIGIHMRAGGEVGEAAIYVMRPQEFMEENPDIKIELVPTPGAEYYAKILIEAAAGTLRDIIFAQDDMSDYYRHVRLGLVAESDSHMDALGISKSEWLPPVVEAMTHEGKMYGMPKSASPCQAFLFYNAEMFEEAGIPLPETRGSTFEEVTEWVNKLTKGSEQDREVFGYSPDVGGILGIYNVVRALGSFALSEDGMTCLADGPEWYEMCRWTSQFYEQNMTPMAEQLPTGGRRALFAGRKLALYHGGRWEWKGLRDAVQAEEKPFAWDVIEFPRVADAKGWRPSLNTHDASTFSKHPDEAFKVSYALADKRQAELVVSEIGYLTARVDDNITIDELSGTKSAEEVKWWRLQYDAQMTQESFRGPGNLRGQELNTATRNSLDRLWLGMEPLGPDFMNRFKAEIDDILAKPELTDL